MIPPLGSGNKSLPTPFRHRQPLRIFPRPFTTQTRFFPQLGSSRKLKLMVGTATLVTGVTTLFYRSHFSEPSRDKLLEKTLGEIAAKEVELASPNLTEGKKKELKEAIGGLEDKLEALLT